MGLLSQSSGWGATDETQMGEVLLFLHAPALVPTIRVSSVVNFSGLSLPVAGPTSAVRSKPAPDGPARRRRGSSADTTRDGAPPRWARPPRQHRKRESRAHSPRGYPARA